MTVCTSALLDVLNTTGFCIVQLPTIQAYHALSRSLGKVVQTTEVRLQNGIRQYPYMPTEVPFHTDNPKMRYVAWYCIQQDDNSGATWLIDARKLIAQLSNADYATLQTLSIKMPSRDEHHPLLIHKPNPHIFYVSHLWGNLADTLNMPEKAALTNFNRLIEESRNTDAFLSFRLKPGEALILNNEFMLHGRGKIDPLSSRYLVRNYIQP